MSQNNSFFMKVVKKESTKQFKKQERYLKRKLTREEKKEIIKETKSKTKTKFKIIGVMAVSAIAGMGGAKIIKNFTTFNTVKHREIYVSENSVKQNDREKFINGIKADVEEIQKPKTEEEIKAEVTEEINKLRSAMDCMQYIQSIYLDEYNVRYKKEYTLDDIEIYKEFDRGYIYESTAQNGDKIIRRTLKNKFKDNSMDEEPKKDYSIITVELKNEKERDVNTVINYNGEFKKLYEENENVEEDEETLLMQLGKIIYTGMEYIENLRYGEMDIDDESSIEYKDKLKNMIVEFEYNKQNNKKYQNKTNSKEEKEV